MINLEPAPIQKRRARSQGGSILIEFCISAIILLMLFAGAADFGRLFYYSDLVTNAARAGTQYCLANMAPAATNPCYNLSNPPSSGISAPAVTAIQAAATGEKGDTNNLTVTAATPTMVCLCSTATGSPTASNCSGNCSGGTWEEWVQVNTSYTFNTLIAWPNIPQSTVLHGSSTIEVH